MTEEQFKELIEKLNEINGNLEIIMIKYIPLSDYMKEKGNEKH